MEVVASEVVVRAPVAAVKAPVAAVKTPVEAVLVTEVLVTEVLVTEVLVTEVHEAEVDEAGFEARERLRLSSEWVLVDDWLPRGCRVCVQPAWVHACT